MPLRRAALFDMDRTLIRRDTASLYVRYQRDLGEVGRGYSLRVAWWLLKYTLGVIDAEKVAERALASYRGKEEAWMEDRCRGWFRDYVLPHVTDSGREAVRRHRDAGDRAKPDRRTVDGDSRRSRDCGDVRHRRRAGDPDQGAEL